MSPAGSNLIAVNKLSYIVHSVYLPFKIGKGGGGGGGGGG